MSGSQPRFPNKFVVLGVSFVLVGTVLLIWTAGFLDRVAALWPLLPLLAGLVVSYYGIFRHGPDYYIFAGTSLVLGGVLLLLTTTVLPTTLARIWPLFMTIIGVAMLAYGLRKRTITRLTFTIPGGAMIFLSGLFLPFSLELVQMDFADFVAVWWPAIFVLAGGSLLFAHLFRAKRQRD
jgi:hypothetical protein